MSTTMSFDNNCEQNVEKNNNSRFRRFLSQFVATSVKNLLMFNMGLCILLPTIIIPAVTGIHNEHNQNEFLTITPVQASWLGSLMYLIQPIGCLMSVPIADPLGRKRSMILVNIPFAIGWYTLYQASTVSHVFIGITFLGLAIGLMESAIVTYIGEICEASFRGILMSYSYICVTTGMFMTTLLNTMMAWRMVCLAGLTLPVISTLALFFIPESPHWLISKNRTEAAENSLQWLRGWMSNEAIAQEFINLKRHSERSKSCDTCTKQDLECTHPLPTMSEKLIELKRKRTLKPLFIVISLFFLAQFTGMLAMKPFLVQIFKAYNSPIPADQAAAILGTLENLSNVTLMLLISFTGKRRFYLFGMSVTLACVTTITWFGYTYLPPGYISFDQAHHEPFQLENKALGYIPFFCLIMWAYFSLASLITLPWLFLSELFPFKSRSMTSGVAAATNYVFGFMAKKTYYNLETMLSLSGVSLLYACICFGGLILMYNILPETENRSLEEIELHFADNSKKITDRNIVTHSKEATAEPIKHENTGQIIETFAPDRKVYLLSMKLKTKI
ncbi:facilitated trehalose transporter Tret1-like [Contarinia nasturtii]|uniref:facilitated trehalose transporter Tret1-like n=1 Tax=Contarinia nasturtii TaxID=265458 RepID=UPI0012D43431|nr:facilitated trehalose transporter Tret1-like [Contarinia nasturtii]